jgi:hypothetical protein
MNKPASVTVTFDYADYSEVCNLLQLIAVVGIKLWMQGLHQPDKARIMSAFDAMCKAGMEAHNVANHG